jgi:hypothetical protein
MPSIPNGHGRPQSSPGPTTAVAADVPLHRWNSQSKASNRSSACLSRGSFAQSSQDLANLEHNRESMKPLSDFLMTKDPPPNNWVSIPSDDERSLRSLKKSAFKLFGSRKNKKHKAPRFLQLPDSAVAAKTRSGARHIAISIPIEHDHIEPPKPPPPLYIQPPQRTLSLDQPDRSAVTILKPVAEVRESGSSYLSSGPKSRNSAIELGRTRPESVITSPTEVWGPDASKTLQNYYTRVDEQQKSSGEEPRSARFDPARSQKSYIAASPVRQDSQRSDPRHSGGTAYSTVSLGTFQEHSRGASSVSTAPSATLISSLKLDLPPRTSSVLKIPFTVRTELAQTSKLVNEVPQMDPLSTVRTTASETTTVTSNPASTPSPPTVFTPAKAEIIRRYSAADGPQLIRSLTPKGLSPAPSKKLPEVSSLQVLSRPKTAPHFEARPTAMAQLKEAEARHARDGTEDSLRMTRQSRQDRVKARKQRDIERLRSKSGSRAPLTEAVLPPNTAQDPPPKPPTTTKFATPPRNPKRANPITQEIAKRKAANSITPIMLVANLAPYTGLVLPIDLPTPRTPGKTASFSNSNSNATTIRSAEHTPPRSLYSSDSDAVPLSRTRSRRAARSERMLSPTGSILESRRRERRVKRNVREREKELDIRLGRIERDNRLLMSTLSGIANSFGELSRRVERNGMGIGNGLGREKLLKGLGTLGSGDEEQSRGFEPVMRELQILAPSISRESIKRTGVDDFDEDDGGSILL